MSGINKVIILGRLATDPGVKYAANGNAIANFNVATSEEWKDKNTGEKQEKSEFHRVAIFGKLAEIAGQYLTKGSQVYLEGKLQTRKWQDQNGQDRYTTEVVLSGFDGVMQMLGGGNQNNDAAFGNSNFNQQPQMQSGAQITQNHNQNQQAMQAQAPQQDYRGHQGSNQENPTYAPNDFQEDDVPF